MRTIEALKNLAVAIKGSGQVSDIPGDTIPEVIEQITAGLDVFDAHIGFEMESLVFRMSVVSDKDRHGAAAGNWNQLNMLQQLILAFRSQCDRSQVRHL